MKTFNSFLAKKSLNQLAEKCVREQLPIIEFTLWYEEEGQHLGEGWKTNMGLGAAAGAGIGGTIGSVIPGVGTAAGGLAGAGIGALAGGAKSLWDRYGRSAPQQAQQAQATPQAGQFDPNNPMHQQRLAMQQAAQTRGQDQAAEQKIKDLQAKYMAVKKQDPLFQDLGDDLLGNLAYNGVDPGSFSAAVQKNMGGGATQEQAVEKTLIELGIRTRGNTNYAWNPSKSAYECTKQDAISALNRLVELNPNINLDEVITVVRCL